MWYLITSQQATPIAPPKAMPTCCTSVYHCHACLEFRRVLPICRKSGRVSATLTNELLHMLLWMVSRRIGSTVIWSRKTKIICVRAYFWRQFSPFWETLMQLLILRPRNLLRAMILNERIKNMLVWLWVGQWVWPGGMWLDITPYTHSIFLSWDYYYMQPTQCLSSP